MHDSMSGLFLSSVKVDFIAHDNSMMLLEFAGFGFQITFSLVIGVLCLRVWAEVINHLRLILEWWTQFLRGLSVLRRHGRCTSGEVLLRVLAYASCESWFLGFIMYVSGRSHDYVPFRYGSSWYRQKVWITSIGFQSDNILHSWGARWKVFLFYILPKFHEVCLSG